MSAADGLAALAQAFTEADQLNRQALALLRQGGAVEALAPLFGQKEALQARLERLLPLLNGLSNACKAGPSLSVALTAQAAAARSEAQLSEALSKIVSSDGKAKSAYQQNHAQKPGKAWDGAG